MNSIFISSTFRDMNYERDILNRRIAPRINRQLRQYNQTVRILDLRWGVDTTDMTEQEATDQVMAVCLDSIASCMPYFVVLIGDRYGYIPEGRDISVTHMEILRGALERADKDHIYIYIREADYIGMPKELRDVYIEKNETSRAQLKQLTDQLLQQMPQCCRRYAAKWDTQANCLVSGEFESILLKDLENDLVENYRGISYQSELQRQLSESEETLAQNSLYAYADKARLDDHICSILKADRPWALIGTAGAGKSVYMSLLCSALRAAGKKVQILFCGDNVFSASVRNAAETVLYALMDSAGMEYDFVKYSAMPYPDLIGSILQIRESVQNKVYIFLDAVDKCDQGMMDFVIWCGNFLAEQAQLVISSRDTQQIGERKETLRLSRMVYTGEDYRQIADRILEMNGKRINPGCIELVLSKIQTPLQLQLLLMRLLRLDAEDFDKIQMSGGGMEQINSYLRKVIDESPEDLESLVTVYLQDLLEESKNPAFFLFLLKLLATSEYGLHEDDLRKLCELAKKKWTALEYVVFLEQYAFFIRVRENGRLDISHDIIRQTLRQILKKSNSMFCDLLSAYWTTLEHHDSLSIRSFFEVVHLGKHTQALQVFARVYRDHLSSLEHNDLGAEIHSGVRSLFFKDGGALLIQTIVGCEDPESIFAMYTMVSASLLTIDDYLKEEQALLVVCVVAEAAFRLLNGVNKKFLQLAMDECAEFLQKNNVSREKIEDFRKFCQNEMNSREKEEPSGGDGSIDGMLARLHRTEGVEQVLLWNELLDIAREMASDQSQARIAEHILTQLLPIAENDQFAQDADQRQFCLADLHSCFGAVYKTLRQWEKGLDHHRRSRDIFQKIYENTPSQDVYRKYCNKMHNIAGILNAWAMTEKNDPILWEKARKACEDAYTMELTQMATGVSERRTIKAASAILNMGTALINTDRYEEGMKKYAEGIALILDSARNHDAVSIYTDLCLQMFECIIQLLQCKKLTAAAALAKDTVPHLSAIIRSGDEKEIERLKESFKFLFPGINRVLSQFMTVETAPDHLIVARMARELYEVILPVASAQEKLNLVVMTCNMCSIVMFGQNDYDLAYREYQHLLEMTVRENLAAPDENGRYMDAVSLRLVDAYSRILICLEKMERDDEAKKWVDEAERWAVYFSDRLEADRGDVPKVLFMIFSSLQRNGSRLGLLFLMMAFNATQKEGYDQSAHPETVMQILTALSLLTGDTQT